MGIEMTAFISYRRSHKYHARTVYQDLKTHGYDVFLDYESIDAGSFEQIILNQIAARAHFIVILTPSALERCKSPKDWLRREIEFALDMKRNVVPLMFDQFNFNDVQKYLVGKLATLPQYNALEIPAAYFDEAMERLRTRFLNKPLEVILHPTPKADEAVVKKAQANEVAQPAVQVNQLEAEKWYEFAFKNNMTGNHDAALAEYTQAIQYNPKFVQAYINRGSIHHEHGNFQKAIADYIMAVRLDEKCMEGYWGLGICYYDQERWREALMVFEQCLALPSNDDRGWMELRVEEIREILKQG